jgi:Ca2+-binding RTX toxin-like protein
MTAYFRTPRYFRDYRLLWDEDMSLLPVNAPSLLDAEADRGALANFHHALLTFPLTDPLLSSAASFAYPGATRAFDLAGPDSLAEILSARPAIVEAHAAPGALFEQLALGANAADTGDILNPGGGNAVDTGPRTSFHSGHMISVWADFVLGAGETADMLAAANRVGDAAVSITGNALAQTIAGSSGANMLDGGGGADTLSGGGGRDSFAFTTTPGADNIDRITDFTLADDRILLGHAVFAEAGAPGTLSAEAFNIGVAAVEASDRIIYNFATGALYYDPDGTGAAAQVQFATLSPGLMLTAAHFSII